MDKFCNKCQRTKPLTDFGTRKLDKKHTTGYHSECRGCRTGRQLQWQKISPTWADADRAGRRARWPATAARYADQREARSLLQAAVRWNRISKDPCFICGENEVHGHHVAYDMPLDVVWLCAAHHRELHFNH